MAENNRADDESEVKEISSEANSATSMNASPSDSLDSSDDSVHASSKDHDLHEEIGSIKDHKDHEEKEHEHHHHREHEDKHAEDEESVSESKDSDRDKEDKEDKDSEAVKISSLSLDEINDILGGDQESIKSLPRSVRQMAQRQKDNSKRIEETIKKHRTNPAWLVPVIVIFICVGIVWVIATYITGMQYPIPFITFWNVVIGFALMLIGFLFTMMWH